MYPPASPSLSHFAQAYVSGLLLSHRKTPHAMWDEGFLPTPQAAPAPSWAKTPTPTNKPSHKAPEGPKKPLPRRGPHGLPHTGPRVQGLGRVYHTGRKAPVWGHLFLSSPWSTPTGTLTPWPSSPSPPPAWRLLYPKKTPSEALLDEVFDLLALEPGLSLKARGRRPVQRGLTLRSLLRAGVPFVGRDAEPGQGPAPGLGDGGGGGGDTGGGSSSWPTLPGRRRYYRRFGVYAKRVR